MTPLQWHRLEVRVYLPDIQLWGVKAGQPEGANGGYLTAGQDYSVADRRAVATWLNDREAGYPSLKRFEGGKNWPA